MKTLLEIRHYLFSTGGSDEPRSSENPRTIFMELEFSNFLLIGDSNSPRTNIWITYKNQNESKAMN